jgi:hypothetical protein
MKTTFVPLFALFFVSTLSAQVRNDQPQLAGHITKAGNGSPIAGAIVSLVPPIILGRFNFQSAKTDQYGNYRFDEVSDGTYSIHASADGFVDQNYKKDTSLGGAFVRFGSSIHIEGVDFQLRPESLIRGAVTDNSGRPIASITVAAVRQRDAARNHPVPVSSARSDASGQFVLKKLPADVYLVCASGPAGFGDPPGATRWYRETWFGDASSTYGAVPISLKQREIRTGVRISVGDELRYRIVVRPSGPEGEPVPDRYDVTIENRNHSSMRRGDGSYVIPDIPPGHYTLVSTAWSQAQYLGRGSEASMSLTPT